MADTPTPPPDLVKAFAKASAAIGHTLQAADDTEFKHKTVGINTFLAAVGPPLRDNGLLLVADQITVEEKRTMPRRFIDSDGIITEEVCESVIEFTFKMGLQSFDGTLLWPLETVITHQRGTGPEKRHDPRPEFWSGKARSYAIKTWLGRKLMLDMGETGDDPDTARTGVPLSNPEAAPRRATAPAKPKTKPKAKPKAEPAEQKFTYDEMHDYYVAHLGEAHTEIVWEGRQRGAQQIPADKIAAALALVAAHQDGNCGCEPFDTGEPAQPQEPIL